MIPHKFRLGARIITDLAEAEKTLAESSKYLSRARQARIAVVIPTYNEKDNIRQVALRIWQVVPQAYIVVVDDDSPDGTGVIADDIAGGNPNMRVIHRKGTRGLGFAYADGFRFVLNNLAADYIFEMDADLSHNPRYLPLFLYYAEQYPLVTGSRFLRRVSIKNRSVWRNVISKTSKWFINVVTGLNLSDTTTGFKCFRRDLLEKMDLSRIKSRGFSFQIEVSYTVNKMGVSIKEIPILFIERTAGNSKMSAEIMREAVFLVFKLFVRRLKKNSQ